MSTQRWGREPEEFWPAPFLVATEWTPGPDFQLELGPRTIAFAAVIDRIEFDPRRDWLALCDFKTGRAPWPTKLLAEYRAGTHLQLGLYALVVAQVVAANPALFGLERSVPVGALRLEYLRRQRLGSRLVSVVRSASPRMSIGRDANGGVWNLAQAAAAFTLAFVLGIESGHFPVVARVGLGRRLPPSMKRIAEVARVLPGLGERDTGLPDPLEALEGEFA